MPQQEHNVLYLPDIAGSVQGQWEGLDIAALPGRVAIAMDTTESRGSILLSDRQTVRADSGTVIHAGEGVSLMPGDRVIVRPYDGAWYPNWRGTGQEVRFYGVASEWDESILLVIHDGKFYPTSDWTLMEREQEESSITLRNSPFKSTAKVIAAGPLAKVEVAAVGIVNWLKADILTFRFGLSEHALVRASQILAEEI